jgi:hypothetical protein
MPPAPSISHERRRAWIRMERSAARAASWICFAGRAWSFSGRRRRVCAWYAAVASIAPPFCCVGRAETRRVVRYAAGAMRTM